MNLLSPQQSSARSPRSTFTRMFIGMFGVVTFFFGIVIEGESYLTGNEARGVFFLLLLAVFAGVEFLHIGYDGPLLSRLGLLAVRIALVEGMISLDFSGIAIFLHPINIFIAYFAFNESFAAALSLLYLASGIFRVAVVNPEWYLNSDNALLVVAFASMLVFMQILAAAMDKDEKQRQQTEELLADLQASHIKLQAYAEHVAEMAATEERNRLARDIHDSLGHYLTAVKIQLEKAMVFQARDPEAARDATRSAQQAATAALQDIRRSVGALRERAPFSLRESLEELVNSIQSDQLSIDLIIRGEEYGYARSVLITLYRSVQEGLTNIQKHADAQNATINIELGEDAARLALSDDGAGFDQQSLPSGHGVERNFGLQGIRERIALVRGQMTLESEVNQGTRLTLTVPKDPLMMDDIQFQESWNHHEE
ncbi:MAG: sensor histidine kinase [Anaerolineales bacterium]|nr:sensor histidine kinase [Anaerolineales bacterium]